MEQAVNTWSKGLQMDTNPMMQGTDTLTNALNGTQVTMNGDEVVLQNDMGNRKIDNAYLPVGYEPVGIKEYGGIIYLAIHNPLTGQSQIGSFPSPERVQGKEYNLGGYLSFGTKENIDLSSFSSYFYKGVKFLYDDKILIQLTGDISLHVGDKFIVNSSYIWKCQNIISNFNNTYGNKIKTTKNKYFNLALGVLNSQNEFVDITKSLVRWGFDNNQNYIKSYDNNESDLFQFNDGYFIANGIDNKNPINTIDNNNFIQNRTLSTMLKADANTYAYKLIGPMYLSAKLNIAESINYNTYAYKFGENVDLTIEATIKYNYPDGIEGGSGNEIYQTFSNNSQNIEDNFDENIGFQIFRKTSKNSENYEEKLDAKSVERTNYYYDLNTNQYSITIKKTYSINSDQFIKKDKKLFSYYLCTTSSFYNDTYIKGLSFEHELDYDLIGSGKIFLRDWNFTNDSEERTGVLKYSFDCYPEPDMKFTDLKFIFCSVADSTNAVLNDKIVISEFENIENSKFKIISAANNDFNNGTLNISWENDWDKEMLNVFIQYKYIKENENSDNYQSLYYDTVGWYLTTDLFNGRTDNNFINSIKKADEIKIDAILEVVSNNVTKDNIESSLYSEQYQKTYTVKQNAKCDAQYKVSLDFNQIENLYPKYFNYSIKGFKLEDPIIKVEGISSNLTTSSKAEISRTEGSQLFVNHELELELKGTASGSNDKKEYTVENNFIKVSDYIKNIINDEFEQPFINLELWNEGIAFSIIPNLVIIGNNELYKINEDYDNIKAKIFDNNDFEIDRENNIFRYKLYDKWDNIETFFNSNGEYSRSNNLFIIGCSPKDWYWNKSPRTNDYGGEINRITNIWIRYQDDNKSRRLALFDQIKLEENDNIKDKIRNAIINSNKLNNYYYNAGQSIIKLYGPDSNNILYPVDFSVKSILNINNISLSVQEKENYNNINTRISFESNLNTSIQEEINLESSNFPEFFTVIDSLRNNTILCYCQDHPNFIQLNEHKSYYYNAVSKQLEELNPPGLIEGTNNLKLFNLKVVTSGQELKFPIATEESLSDNWDFMNNSGSRQIVLYFQEYNKNNKIKPFGLGKHIPYVVS